MKPQMTPSEKVQESGDQDMYLFGLFPRYLIIIKEQIYLLLEFQISVETEATQERNIEMNNSMFYPQLEFSSTEKSRLYRALMSFSSAYNDVLSGPIIDRTNFNNLFGLLYFDLRNQRDDVKDSVVSLTFRYQLTGNPAGNYTLNALILHEKEIELYTSSGKLLIKA